MAIVGRNARRAIAAAFAAMLLFAAQAGAKPKPRHPIDLNTATIDQLEELPGIGPKMAQRILDFREKSGPFERVTDLRAIRGIGRKRFEKIRPYVTVTPARDSGGRKSPYR